VGAGDERAVWLADRAAFQRCEGFLFSAYRAIRRVLVNCRITPALPRDSREKQKGNDDQHLQESDLTYLLQNAPRRIDALIVENVLWYSWMSSLDGTVAALMRDGMSQLRRGNHDRAQQLFKQVVEIDPGNSEACNKLAAISSSEKDHDLCIYWAEQALKRNPNHFGALTGLGLAHEQMGQVHQAIDCFRRALTQHPWAANVPTILLSLGETWEKGGAGGGGGGGDALGSAVEGEGGGGEDDEENEDGQGKSEKEEDRR
jgi:tetratricopeptide (TPR) repeat protein